MPIKYPIHPYVLGLLLGDGCMNRHQITLAIDPRDQDILYKVSNRIPKNLKVKKYNRFEYGISSAVRTTKPNPLMVAIRELGINVKSYKKFIPKLYRKASKRARINVLQGLLDSDGGIGKNWGRIFFTSTSKKLVKHIIRLVHSLNGQTSKYDVTHIRTYLYKGKLRPKRAWSVVYIKLPKDIIPVKSVRKLKIWRKALRKGFKSSICLVD